MKKEITVIGLGKMGANIVRRLKSRGWSVRGTDASSEVTTQLAAETGMHAMQRVSDVSAQSAPRLVWLMVPAGKPVEDVLFGDGGLTSVLQEGDVVMDGGNSFYKDAIEHGAKLAERGIRFIDVGFSGGPAGALNGGCLMVGGDESAFTEFETLFQDLSKDGTAYAFFPGAGAGHFVKMVHNGIEYGMMQAIGEGFEILKKAPFGIDLIKAAQIYNRGSVIESRLIGWTQSALEEGGVDLADISSVIGHTGEGKWTAETALELGVDAPVITTSYQFRVDSGKKESFAAKIVAALRGQFGGHSTK